MVIWQLLRFIVGAACCRKDDGELFRPENEPLSGFDQPDCFCAAGTGVFKPASRASLSARNRAVFSRIAFNAAWYSAIACWASCDCFSRLNAASALRLIRIHAQLPQPQRATPVFEG